MPLRNRLALPAPAQDLLEPRRARAPSARRHPRHGEPVELFFRKIEHGLNERAQLDELRVWKRADRRGKLSLERAQRRSAPPRGFAAIDQVGRLASACARSSLPLEKGAPRELARLGEPRARIKAGGKARPASPPGRRAPAARASPPRCTNAVPGNRARCLHRCARRGRP